MWTGIVVFIGLFLFWSMALRIARDELVNPTGEQLNSKSRWDRPWTMVVASVVCACVSVWIFVADEVPQILGICFAFMGWFFFRGIGIAREWMRLKQRYREQSELDR